jgi:hypothetical protein
MKMKNMKKLFTLIGVAGVLFATNLYASFDGTVVLTQGLYSYANGGEFTAAVTGLGTFQTFCIEYNEEFYPWSTYNYKQNTGAVAGGLGVDATDPNTGLPMDNISIGTAWLYSQFRAGTLANYFSGTVSVQNQNAGNLQVAIWYLENEVNSLTFNGANGTAFFNAAIAGTSTDGTTVFNDSNGAYNVIALNLFTGGADTSDNPGSRAQDQLAIVPEPTTMIAGALLLLPFGASTLRILRRNRAA